METGAKQNSTIRSNEARHGGEDGLERIRQILTGAHEQHCDAQLAEIERRLTRETVAIREEFRDRISKLENELRREVDGLTKSLDGTRRSLAERKLDRTALASLLQDLGVRLLQVEEELAPNAPLKKAG